jgi:hypothetical protein
MGAAPTVLVVVVVSVSSVPAFTAGSATNPSTLVTIRARAQPVLAVTADR